MIVHICKELATETKLRKARRAISFVELAK